MHKPQEEVVERMSLQVYRSMGHDALIHMSGNKESRRGKISYFKNIDFNKLVVWVGLDFLRKITGNYVYYPHNIAFQYNESTMKLKAVFEIARGNKQNKSIVLKAPSMFQSR